ncbi:hypothetical protein [Granulicella paludicola]|uniref:hypothetical protein n=1 Tax=Granulicella paludicola TaxID=474951 RepID=UPI0021E0C694|nr:hypothetical protein [Granulicella paludicola]
MAITGTFNGAQIVALPIKPSIKQIELAMNDTVSASRSPFSGATQLQVWPGADWWEANITLPQMVESDAMVWTAFLSELRGMMNSFYLGDPLRVQPSGSALGSPVVNGVNAAMATTLNTRGWTANSTGLLLPGDMLQIGVRLHRVLDAVNADANGDASISIWPSIREATTDGQAIILNNPQGLFRLAENRRSSLTTETRLSGISFKAVEAR